MKLSLSGFDSIEHYYEEWIKNPAVMTLLIIGDVQTYVETYTENEFAQLNDQAVLKKIPDLLNEFKTVKRNDKEELKKVYLKFIKNLTKDFRTASVKDENIETYFAERTQDLDENEVGTKGNEISSQPLLEENSEAIENEISHLDALINKIPLSTFERSALNYLRDRKQKDKILENFTLQGIIQLANRAVYKIFLYKNVRVN